jgi:uncharacterized protein YceH (UPF0502 family)
MAETTWEPLTPLQRRILGVLVEKQKTSKTADTYPLSLNALTTGCNQKSNRDPVLDLSEDDVAEALPALQQAGLASKITGGRVDRWKHLLYEKWNVNAAEMAVLAELLLRGPQTVGDLRGRADRMSPIASLDELQAILKPLAERNLIVYFTDPERRGAMLTHGFHLPEELAAARATAGSGASFEASPRTSAPPADSKMNSLVKDVEMLKETVNAIREEIRELKKQLGVL